MELTDYPGLKDGDVYIVAMASGDGEEALTPIVEHVKADQRQAYLREPEIEDALVILVTPLEEWVDMLEVWRGDDIVASWSRSAGWREL